MRLHSGSSPKDRALMSKACSRTAYLAIMSLISLLYPPVVTSRTPQQNGKTAASDVTQNRSPLSENIDKPQMLAILDQLATEAISQDKLFLGKTRFTISKADGTYSYDSAPLPASSVLRADDQYGKPLESLIRIKALRRDFGSAVPNTTFWVAPLEEAEKAVQNCVRELESLSAQSVGQQCDTAVEASFRNLDKAVHDYAAANKLQLVQWQKRDPALGYKVTLKISPEKAHLYLMPLLEYKKCHYPGSPVQACQWNEVLDPQVQMIGWYHYRADWPQDLNGPDEGDFEVTEPGTYTFTPKNK
jgi:hypothetical protein